MHHRIIGIAANWLNSNLLNMKQFCNTGINLYYQEVVLSPSGLYTKS